MNNKTESIWKEFSDQIKNFIIRRVQDTPDADDILQEIFLKIHSHIDTLKDDTKIKSWIYQIARNTLIDFYRKQKTKVEITESILPTDEIHEESPAEEIASGLRGMVEALPEKYAEALVLTEFQGLTQKDLSKNLGISISGAKTRVQRARNMLKDNLMRCCHYEFDRFGTIIDYHPIKCCCCSESEQ
jgi:RNA polymerase sigma-70 factor (ECF subfamily)